MYMYMYIIQVLHLWYSCNRGNTDILHTVASDETYHVLVSLGGVGAFQNLVVHK